MDIDALKANWRNINIDPVRLEQTEERVRTAASAGKLENAQDRLIRMTRTNVWGGALLMALAPLLNFILDFPVWVAVIYALAGFIFGVSAFRLYCRVSGPRYVDMPVVTALAAVIKLRRDLARKEVGGILLATIVVGAMFGCAISDNFGLEIIISMAIGVAIGLPLGLTRYFRIVNLTKRISKELQSCLSDDARE